MMNTRGEGIIEFSNAEIEAKNDGHFSFSAEANAGDAEQEYRKVDRINTESRMAESLSEQLREERSNILITNLPQELLTMIFSHLEAHLLLTTGTRVCRYFHDVLKTEGFWKGRKTLNVNEKESGINFIMMVIPKCPNIRHLNVNFCRKGPKTSLTIPNMSFPYLHSLVMTNVDFRAENAVEMIVQGAPHLREIKLEGVTTKKMLEVLASLTELTTFSVHGKNDNFTEYDERMLSNVFKSCPKLETVFVQLFHYLDVDPLLILLEVCSRILKRLSWGGELSDLVMKKISTCPQIVHLDIFGIGITNESVRFIRNMKQIETLRLRSFFIYDDTVRLTNVDYIEMFKDNAFPHLKHLSFDGCEEVNDTVLEVIATNVKDLESLALNDTNVTDLGIHSMLTCCSNLKALSLCGLKLDDNFFIKYLPICCPRLHFLGFSIPVPDTIIQEFLKTHPSYNLQKCEELTDLNFDDLISINLSNLSLKPIIAYYGDDDVEHVIGHK